MQFKTNGRKLGFNNTPLSPTLVRVFYQNGLPNAFFMAQLE